MALLKYKTQQNNTIVSESDEGVQHFPRFNILLFSFLCFYAIFNEDKF